MSFRNLLSTLAVVLAFGAGEAGAALLDVGPTVPQVINSSEPNLGHGFPLWYRDANRIPLQLCTDRISGMCLTAEPNPGAPLSFPSNIGDELFWWVGDAQITTGTFRRASLVQAIEAAFSTGDAVPGKQVSFARIRIRFDPLPVAGEYIVTTPFKQFIFDVPANALEINHTEDIGIQDGVFTGALEGSIGPFLYCKNSADRPAGFIGNPGATCEVLGSTYTPPGSPPPGYSFPANYFRIQGPGGFDHYTNLFTVVGKLHTESIATPLDIPKVSYARGPNGMQVNVFATTQPLSNQVNAAAPFPANYALTGAPSALEFTGTDLPTLALTTNNPADGSFFKASGIFAAPVSVPPTVTVTNTADTPPTVKNSPLVDEVIINHAVFSPQTGSLSISAASLDRVAAPELQAFIPGMTAPLGTLANGALNVAFPVTDTAVNPNKTYQIPPATITVKSAIGGQASAAVTTFLPVATPATGIAVEATPAGAQISGGQVAFTATATGGDAGPYEYRYLWRSATGTFVEGRSYGPASWNWDTTGLPAGAYFLQIFTRHSGATGDPDAVTTIGYNLVGSDPLNGICGTSNGQFFSSAPTTGLCSTGTPSAVTGTGPWSWNCAGLNGGTAATCSGLFQTYTITFTTNGNGTISGTTPQTVFHGGSATVMTAIPGDGAMFSTWTDQSSQVVGASPSLILTNVISDMTVTANFIPTYNIILDRCISGPTVVGQGSLPGYTFDAAGFDVAATLNGAPITLAASSYTFTDGIAGDQRLSATYTINPVGTTAPVRLVRANGSFIEHTTLQSAYDAAVTGDTILLKAGTLSGAFSAGRNVSITIKGGYEASFTRNCGTTRIGGGTRLRLGTIAFDRVNL